MLADVGAIVAAGKGVEVNPGEFQAWKTEALPVPEISGEDSLARCRAGVMAYAGA